MKRTILFFLTIIVIHFGVNAQNGIDFSHTYGAGGKLQMFVDSSAKNVYYMNVFPNQPNTSFNYLPEINNVSIRVSFRKNIKIQNYRYTILVDDKPFVLNKLIDMAQLENTNAGRDEEVFRSTTLGTFSIKGKVVTVLGYDIEKPQVIDKVVFYGKPIPKAKIEGFASRFKTDKGVDYSYVIAPKENTKLLFNEKYDELTVVKDKSDIDYLYRTSVKDRQTDKVIFESTAWQYGSYINEAHELSPYVKIDKNIFRKSGDYEIVIQPFIKELTSLKDAEKYASRYTLSITLAEESYTKKELYSYALMATFVIGVNFLLVISFIKKRNKKKLAENERQKNTAKIQLDSIRSQLNPHFMFNALAGIQSLMNQNKIDEANDYLGRFSRLTRNVLDKKELVSLAEEKDLLTDYLIMEQQRFGFMFAIHVADGLDLNTEIPAMLLQPFAENAIKHGIAGQNNGDIQINFVQNEQDLILQIADNGKGFDILQEHDGYGIKLSKGRVELLASLYPQNPIVLDMQSNKAGTTVTFTLKHWL